MALFPLQAVFDGDFVVLLVPVDDEDPMTVIADKVAHHVVDHRVAAQDRPLRVRHDGNLLPDDATVVSAGVGPLDVLQVGYDDPHTGGAAQPRRGVGTYMRGLLPR